jgi:hypothetical protein
LEEGAQYWFRLFINLTPLVPLSMIWIYNSYREGEIKTRGVSTPLEHRWWINPSKEGKNLREGEAPLSLTPPSLRKGRG